MTEKEPYSFLSYDPDFQLPAELVEGFSGTPGEVAFAVEKNALTIWATYGGDTFAPLMAFIGPVFFDPDYGTLSLVERKLIALVTSNINNCPSCLISHGVLLGNMTNHAYARRVAANYHQVPLTKRERALADYAAKLTANPGEVGAGDVETLRAAGLTDQDIFHVIETICAFNLTNRFSNGLGLRLDDDFLDGLTPTAVADLKPGR